MLISATLVCSFKTYSQFFEHAQFAHDCGSNNFQNFKIGTNYLELHRSCWAALIKNSVGSNFPKKVKDSHLIQTPPQEKKQAHTQTKLSERKKGGCGEARTYAISVCKDRHHTDKSDVWPLHYSPILLLNNNQFNRRLR